MSQLGGEHASYLSGKRKRGNDVNVGSVLQRLVQVFHRLVELEHTFLDRNTRPLFQQTMEHSRLCLDSIQYQHGPISINTKTSNSNATATHHTLLDVAHFDSGDGQPVSSIYIKRILPRK